MADGPTIAEADGAYEQWVAKEIVWSKINKDVQMGEATLQDVGEQREVVEGLMATAKMSHIEVSTHLVWKHSHQTVAESNDDNWPKVTVPPGSILHEVPCVQCTVKGAQCIGPVGKMCDRCTWMKQGCKKSNKGQGAVGKHSATCLAKAGPSKKAAAKDKEDIEIVETCRHSKGKVPARGGVDKSTAMALSQALTLVRAEAIAAHAANLCLQVCIKQLLEALAKLGVE
ncbi:hypothetical protein M404DRAFT_30171 [Pisolithus tinctorius Marx 270]|uniref:Uncharacterized protein n=1 Tax=Pisolithus tinctorius Marx 270 TaxID=870435 RepID=A0A0C3NF89_PISTI|nr:hypothetical protein M404DRAFT_30171 [Pisolithus tinctorius Marx 270]